MDRSTLSLYTFTVSQSSEKIRWSLDASGLRYREYRLTPFLHHADNFRIAGGLGISLPTLVADGETVQDSTRILEWLETHRAPFALMPAEPNLRTIAMRIEGRFDHVGPHVVRCMYATLLRDAPLVRRMWSLDASIGQRAMMRAGFPVLRRIFERGLDLEDATMERSRRLVERALSELDLVAEQGQVYLVGQRLSVADITAAARFAPLACPDEHPVFSDPEYRDAIAPLVSGWQSRPGLAWVREVYRLHRRVRPTQVLSEAPSAAEAFRVSRPAVRAVPAARRVSGL